MRDPLGLGAAKVPELDGRAFPPRKAAESASGRCFERDDQMPFSRTWLGRFRLVPCLLAAMGFQSPANSQSKPDEDTLWVEGESAAFKRVTANAWYSDA